MRVLIVLLGVVLAGCTAVEIKPVDAVYNLDHVCIEENPKVIVEDFVTTVEDAFNDHGISTEMYSGNLPGHCSYKLTYTALRSWDITPYLSHAELRLYKGPQRIGYAEYHLKGGGGLALNKWDSVKDKMTPVVNQLLAQYRQ